MSIVLLSGGQERSNRLLHLAAVKCARKLKRLKSEPLSLTYFAFCSDNGPEFFHRTKRRYAALGVKKFRYLAADQYPSAKEIQQALKSKLLYFAGGNTFYFLHHLKKSGVFSELKKINPSHKVWIGLSAGALILTQNIKLAGYPKFDSDENEVNLKNLSGLNLVSFDFFPHYSFRSKRLKKALKKYSKSSVKKLIAAPDGSGVLVTENGFDILGKALVFNRGKEFLLKKNL